MDSLLTGSFSAGPYPTARCPCALACRNGVKLWRSRPSGISDQELAGHFVLCFWVFLSQSCGDAEELAICRIGGHSLPVHAQRFGRTVE